MKSLTESLLGKLKVKAQDAESELIAIAKRESANKAADADVKKLENALQLTGKSLAKYQEIVALLQRIKQIEGEASKLPATSAACVKARDAIVAYQVETRQIEKDRREGQLQLELARNADYSKNLAAVKAQSELERLEFARPELFDREAVDPDVVTLTFGDHNNTIAVFDPEAPRQEVPPTVWQEQSSRRARIRDAAILKAREAYQDERNKWIQKQPMDGNGHYVASEPFPKFELPTWGEIVKRGWNVELDGLAA